MARLTTLVVAFLLGNSDSRGSVGMWEGEKEMVRV